MEWIKQIPMWVKGTIAFLTALISFIILVRNNLYLSITVSVASILIASFILSIYFAFSKRKSEFHGGSFVYRFPGYRKLALVCIVAIPLLFATLISLKQTRAIAIVAFGHPDVTSIELISADYKKDSVSYDVIVQNNSDRQQILNKIGVTSLIPGDDGWRCDGALSDIISAGEYVLRFDVGSGENIQKLEPPLAISPNDAIRFTISLVPNDEGLCWNWSSDIVLFIENSQGERIQTSPQHIDESDVLAARMISISRQELMDIVRNSSDAISRAGAIERLCECGWDSYGTETLEKLSDKEKNTLYDLFIDVLQDTSPTVRRAALVALISLQNTNAVPSIILVMQNDEDKAVRGTAAIALGRLRDPRAVKPLGIALQNGESVEFEAADALGMIGDPSAIPYLMKRWDDNISPGLSMRIEFALIKLQSQEAIPKLTQILQSNENEYLRGETASFILAGHPSYISPFLPTLIDLLLTDQEEQVRRDVAYSFRYVTGNNEVVSALGQAATRDSSTSVQLTAIASLERIGTSPAIEQLKIIATSQTGEIKKVAEDALEALGQK